MLKQRKLQLCCGLLSDACHTIDGIDAGEPSNAVDTERSDVSGNSVDQVGTCDR